jgi:glutamyl-tRNA reductase
MLDHAGAERMVCGRARERAQRLVAPEGSVMGVEDLERHLISADVLFCCTSADALLVTRSMLEQGPDGRNALIVVDLSLPHNVDREVAKLPKVMLSRVANS